MTAYWKNNYFTQNQYIHLEATSSISTPVVDIYLRLERLNNSVSDEKDELEQLLEEKRSQADSNYCLLKWWKVKFLVYNKLL